MLTQKTRICEQYINLQQRNGSVVHIFTPVDISKWKNTRSVQTSFCSLWFDNFVIQSLQTWMSQLFHWMKQREHCYLCCGSNFFGYFFLNKFIFFQTSSIFLLQFNIKIPILIWEQLSLSVELVKRSWVLWTNWIFLREKSGNWKVST